LDATFLRFMDANTTDYIGTQYDNLCETGRVPNNIRDVVMGPHAERVRTYTYHQLGIQREFTKGRKVSNLKYGELSQVVAAAQGMAALIGEIDPQDAGTKIGELKPRYTESDLTSEERRFHVGKHYLDLYQSMEIPDEIAGIVRSTLSHLVRKNTYRQLGFRVESLELKEPSDYPVLSESDLTIEDLGRVIHAAQIMASRIDPANYDPEI